MDGIQIISCRSTSLRALEGKTRMSGCCAPHTGRRRSHSILDGCNLNLLHVSMYHDLSRVLKRGFSGYQGMRGG